MAPHSEMRVGGEEIRSEFLADLFQVSLIQLIHSVLQSFLAKPLRQRACSPIAAQLWGVGAAHQARCHCCMDVRAELHKEQRDLPGAHSEMFLQTRGQL